MSIAGLKTHEQMTSVAELQPALMAKSKRSIGPKGLNSSANDVFTACPIDLGVKRRLIETRREYANS
jgi:hypothetical protein